MHGRHSTATRLLAVAAVLTLLAGACSGSGVTPSPTAPPTPTPTATPTPTPTETPSPSGSGTGGLKGGGTGGTGAASDLEGVQQATIQIESDGSFIDPQVGEQVNAAGRGSGVIIDKSGIAITANHVVTGAALLKVWVGGNKDKVYNAQVIGASECSDLAVVKIAGEGFSFVDWYPDTIKVGLDVYAAGFPLGDPEYTLNRGIVSKSHADGETSWSSVDSVIEHDALINPGNSGGPLVTKDGQLLGLNYAGNTAGQSFAIGADEIRKILTDLEAGKDVTWIGVNGEAVKTDTLSGIWVSSVESGSPADKAGIRAGDIITKLENLVLSTDGTMADYCDILRSHRPDAVMSLEILRFKTGERLEGQLNGRELAVVESLGGGDQAGTTGGSTQQPASYRYRLVKEKQGRIETELPTVWSDVHQGNWVRDDKNVGAFIGAAESFEKWQKEYTVPGVFLGVSASLAGDDVDTVLDTAKKSFSSDCTYDARKDYDAYGYVGRYDVYRKCDGTENSFVYLVLKPPDASALVILQLVAAADRDYEAADHAIETLNIVKL